MNNSKTIQTVCDIRANNKITEQYSTAKLVAADNKITRVAAVLETDRLCDMRAGVHLDPHVTELT
jgi:hypothetical protein